MFIKEVNVCRYCYSPYISYPATYHDIIGVDPCNDNLVIKSYDVDDDDHVYCFGCGGTDTPEFGHLVLYNDELYMLVREWDAIMLFKVPCKADEGKIYFDHEQPMLIADLMDNEIVDSVVGSILKSTDESVKRLAFETLLSIAEAYSREEG